MPLMVGFDNEYNNLDDLVEDFIIKYKDKETTFKRIIYTRVLFGAYIYNTDQYIYNFDDEVAFFDKLLDIAKDLNEKEVILYSFFNLAELGSTDLTKLVKNGWEIQNIKDIGNSIYLVVAKDDIKFKLLDVQKITQAFNLDSFLKAMLGETSKGKKEGMHPFKLSIPQLIEYNKLDCKLMMQALMKFFSLMKQISKELGVELTDKDCLNSITLGSFISKILSQMSERLDNNFLNLGKIDDEFNGLNYKQTKTLVKYNKDADKIHQLIAIGKSAYRGGGIIHNITHYYQESKFVNNIDMIDFKSLFPIAGLIASFELNNNIDNYYLDEHTYTHEQATDKIKSLMFDYEHQKINAIILIEGYWKEGSIPLFPQKVGSKNWEDENYKTVYAKNVIFTKRNWVSLFELQQHIKLGFVVTKIHKVYSWKYPKPSERINSLINWFTYLINKKVEAENEGNQGLRYIIKLLLNSSYGKLVEKRVTKIVNNLMGAMITSYSRALMLWIIHNSLQNNKKIYHLATDSLILDRLDDLLIYDDVQEYVRQFIPNYNILSVETHDNPCYAYILKLKTYLIFDKDMNIIKEAHHSISIRRDQAKQFLMYMLEKGKNLEPIKLEKDSWMKVKKYELYAEKIEKSLTLKQKLQIAQEMNLDLDDPNVEEIIKKVATLKLLAMPYKQERIYTFRDDFKVKLSESNPQRAKFVDFWNDLNEYNLFILNFEKDFSKIKDKIKKGVRLNYNTYRKFKIIDKKYQYNASLITRKGIHINNVEDIIVEVKPIALELIEVAPNIKT